MKYIFTKPPHTGRNPFASGLVRVVLLPGKLIREGGIVGGGCENYYVISRTTVLHDADPSVYLVY